MCDFKAGQRVKFLITRKSKEGYRLSEYIGLISTVYPDKESADIYFQHKMHRRKWVNIAPVNGLGVLTKKIEEAINE